MADDRQISDNPASVVQGSYYPQLQASTRALWVPNENLSISAWVRYVDEIEAGGGLDDYWQANINARWTFDEQWAVSLGIRNLIEDNNVEARSQINELPRIYIQSAAFANVRYSF